MHTACWKLWAKLCLWFVWSFALHIFKIAFSEMEIALFCFMGAFIKSNFDGLESPKLWFPGFVGLLELSPTLMNPYSWLWVHQIIQNNARKIPNHFRNFSGSIIIWDCIFAVNTRAGNPWCSLYQTSKVLNVGWHFCKSMRWTLGVFQLNWRNWNNWSSFCFQLKESPPHPSPFWFRPCITENI